MNFLDFEYGLQSAFALSTLLAHIYLLLVWCYKLANSNSNYQKG